MFSKIHKKYVIFQINFKYIKHKNSTNIFLTELLLLTIIITIIIHTPQFKDVTPALKPPVDHQPYSIPVAERSGFPLALAPQRMPPAILVLNAKPLITQAHTGQFTTECPPYYNIFISNRIREKCVYRGAKNKPRAAGF